MSKIIRKKNFSRIFSSPKKIVRCQIDTFLIKSPFEVTKVGPVGPVLDLFSFPAGILRGFMFIFFYPTFIFDQNRKKFFKKRFKSS